MNTPNNVWLQQDTLRRAAKKIACNFFPKPARRDIYSTCLEAGPEIMSRYNKDEHGEMWPWVFLNMLSLVDMHMCAMMIFAVCQSEIPWQKKLGAECLQTQQRLREMCRDQVFSATKGKASSTAGTSTVRTSR